MLDKTAKPNNGTFSVTSCVSDRWSREAENPERSDPARRIATRFNGQTSSSSSTKGSVTSIGFVINPNAKSRSSNRYRPNLGWRTYHTYAHSVSIQKSVLSTSFRSATQATDSTCNG